MTAIRYINRLKKLDQLIRTRSTGNANQLALKLGVSERGAYYCIHELKELGAPVTCSYRDNSYIYEIEGRLRISFDPLIKNTKIIP